MLLITFRFISVLLASLVMFGQVCIAGTWYDDFSDRTLWDWGGTEGFENDEFHAGVKDGRFNFRGRREGASLSLTNWTLGEIQEFTLEMKFMIRNIHGAEPSSWGIWYRTYDEETRKSRRLEFKHVFDALEGQDLTSIRIVLWEVGWVENEFVLIKRLAWRTPFEYEKELWYTLKVEVEGNRYAFSVGDFIVEAEDVAMPAGQIKLRFGGRCNIWLDDFTVTGPNVPDGGPGRGRAVPPANKLATMWGKLKQSP